jgi:hypothetical protein
MSNHIHEDERGKEEAQGQTDSEKSANLEAGKAPAPTFPGRFGTLGRFNGN